MNVSDQMISFKFPTTWILLDAGLRQWHNVWYKPCQLPIGNSIRHLQTVLTLKINSVTHSLKIPSVHPVTATADTLSTIYFRLGSAKLCVMLSYPHVCSSDDLQIVTSLIPRVLICDIELTAGYKHA